MKTQLNVHNIKCGGCVASITDRLASIEGISDLIIDPTTGAVSFDSEDEAAIEKVRTSLQQMGYPEGVPTVVQTAKSYVSCMIGRLK